MATVAVSTVANRVVIGAASAEVAVAAAIADHAETAVAVAVAAAGAGNSPLNHFTGEPAAARLFCWPCSP
jgi:hypothetical protein